MVIMFGSHWLLYKSMMVFFGLGQSVRPYLLFVLLALCVSYILSSIIAHRWDNTFTKLFYWLSAAWSGLLVNLLLASLILWIINKLIITFSINISIFPLAVFFYVIALIFSLYGGWNAFHPVVKNIEVKIKDLPVEWQNKTIVQLSDVHLGHIYGPEFMTWIVARVNDIDPKAVMITGDLFDGMDGNLEGFIAPINHIKAENGVFYITGNHETYLGLDRTFKAIDKTKLKVLDDQMVIVEGLQILGMRYPVRGEKENLQKIVNNQKVDRNKPLVLLHHVPDNIAEAKAIGVNLELSGHTHKGQLFPFFLLTKLIFKGYDYGLHTEGDFNIYITNGVGTWGPPMRTGNRPEIVAIKLIKKD